MKTNYIYVNEVHTFQAHKDKMYLGLTAHDSNKREDVEITLVLPIKSYLEDIAVKHLKSEALNTYKAHLDTL